MKSIVIVSLIFMISACTGKNEKPIGNEESNENPIEMEKNSEEIEEKSIEQKNESPEYIGDSSLCLLFDNKISLHKEISDTLIKRSLNGVKIKSEIKITRTINDCEFGPNYIRSCSLEAGNKKIQFIFNASGMNQPVLTFVDSQLFKVRKLFGNGFSSESDYSFHYDTGKLFQLVNGNYMFVEQPSSWCGTANQFDFYQVLDVRRKEVIQFVERDEFIEQLK